MDKNKEYRYCLNCNSSYPAGTSEEEEIYCSQCGQSSKDSRLSFGRLVKDAISNVFNLDSRLIHTFRDIFYPSKLTRLYIEGRRKYYVNPARLFIFMLIGLITLSIFSLSIENSAMGQDKMYTKAERSKLLAEYNALVDSMDISGNEALLDTIKAKLFRKVKSIQNDTLGKNWTGLFGLRSVEDYGISTYDGIHLTQDSIFKKYKVEGFWEKINVGQFIRVVNNPVGGIKHVIKNMTWAVFITVILLSFIMKLLYIRKSYYLVEHVVLILYSHSLLFLLVALNIICLLYLPLGDIQKTLRPILLLITFFLVFLIQFLSLKKYYKQGVFKTLVKQLIINSMYTLIFNMVVLFVTIISLILY